MQLLGCEKRRNFVSIDGLDLTQVSCHLIEMYSNGAIICNCFESTHNRYKSIAAIFFSTLEMSSDSPTELDGRRVTKACKRAMTTRALRSLSCPGTFTSPSHMLVSNSTYPFECGLPPQSLRSTNKGCLTSKVIRQPGVAVVV